MLSYASRYELVECVYFGRAREAMVVVGGSDRRIDQTCALKPTRKMARLASMSLKLNVGAECQAQACTRVNGELRYWGSRLVRPLTQWRIETNLKIVARKFLTSLQPVAGDV